jgi:septal ring factor EnvC (AmiA/AmiB activator)
MLGAGGLWVMLRSAAPLFDRLLGGFFALRRTLDTDRDRIIDNLRDEITDLRRRLADAEAENREQAGEIQMLQRQLADQDRFITELLRRSGIRREDVVG